MAGAGPGPEGSLNAMDLEFLGDLSGAMGDEFSAGAGAVTHASHWRASMDSNVTVDSLTSSTKDMLEDFDKEFGHDGHDPSHDVLARQMARSTTEMQAQI